MDWFAPKCCIAANAGRRLTVHLQSNIRWKNVVVLSSLTLRWIVMIFPFAVFRSCNVIARSAATDDRPRDDVNEQLVLCDHTWPPYQVAVYRLRRRCLPIRRLQLPVIARGVMESRVRKFAMRKWLAFEKYTQYTNETGSCDNAGLLSCR